MSLSVRRTGVLASAALLGTLLTPLLPAHAVVAGSDVVVFVRDDGIYRADPDALGSAQLLVPAGASGLYELSSSADGQRFGYQAFDVNDAFTAMRTRLVVRDVSGRAVRTVEDRTFTFETGVGGFADSVTLSSNGSVATWVVSDADGSTLRYAELPAGTATDIAGTDGLSSPAFIDHAALLALTDQGSLVSLAGTVAPSTPVAGSPADISYFGVSPDGLTVAYVVDPDLDDIGTLSTAPLTKQPDASYALGTATQVTDAFESFEGPRFSHDGASILWAAEQASGDTELVSAPVAGGATTNLSNTPDALETAVAAGFVDSSPPSSALATPFTLAGTSAVLRWQLPPNGDVAGVTLSRAGKSVYVPAPATSYLDTGLTIGSTYAYTVTAVDRSGNNAAADAGAQRSLTAVSALATFADPTSTATTKAPFLVRFSPSAPSTVRFDVAYRTNGSTGTRSWVENLTGPARTFGAPGGTFATSSGPGSTYQFVVTARDSFGNSSAATSSGKAVVPFDQTRAALSGGANVARSDAWFGSLRVLNAAGQFARIGVTGNRFQVIGERCPTCGIFDVYDGSTRIASVDTRASTRQPRKVLFSRAWGALSYHVLTLRPRGTAGRPNVILDGFAVRR